MKYWRMSMRWGSHGDQFVEQCIEQGIAACGYYYDDLPIVGDCRKLSRDEFEAIWHEKDPQRTSDRDSLANLAYEVKRGDVIYARRSPYIIAKGSVTRGYRFDPQILAGIGCRWEHYVTVDWERIPEVKVLIKPAIVTLLELEGEKLEMMEAAAAAAVRSSLPKGGISRTSDYRRIADATDLIVARGQGFKVSPQIRRAVEQHAMRVAVDHFSADGYAVEDVSAHESCDLRCRRGNEEICVEVKGTQSAGEQILLTSAEVAFARGAAANMALAIVSGIRVDLRGSTRGGELLVIRPWNIDTGVLTPYGYNYTLPPRRAR